MKQNIKIFKSLLTSILIAGAPRTFAIINSTICAALVLGLQNILILPLSVLLHIAAVILCKKDPYFFSVILRHLQKKPYYHV